MKDRTKDTKEVELASARMELEVGCQETPMLPTLALLMLLVAVRLHYAREGPAARPASQVLFDGARFDYTQLWACGRAAS